MSPQYHAFTESDAMNYALHLPDIFTADASLTCREIGDGNLNLVFLIRDITSNRSVILKQALPYAKVVGESWPLTLDRARIEHDALLLQAAHCPDLVPHVYAFDGNLALTAMEDLSSHLIMRKGLIEGKRYPLFAAHIGRFLAQTLFFSSDLGLNQQLKKQRVQQFINPELCKISEDLIFDHPYKNAETNHFNPLIREEVEKIWRNDPLKLEIALLREKFLTHAQALLHGDLHTGSIFITETSTKVIDPEFAFYGPMGFDIGAVIANLLLNYAAQEVWMADRHAREDYCHYLLQTIRDIWHCFQTLFIDLWAKHGIDETTAVSGFRDMYMKRLLQDTAGFAGCKMIRRVIGLAHVADLQTIAGPQARAKAELIALSIGQKLVLNNRHMKSIDDLIHAVQEGQLL